MSIAPVSVDNFRANMVSSTEMIDQSAKSDSASFEQTLLKAFDSMNEKQQKTDEISQKLIVDPDSVNAHDVTIAMAEANLSLKIAQTVMDRVIKDWNDITTTR